MRAEDAVTGQLDLVVADATLRGRAGRWQLGIDGGTISAVTQETSTGREEVDAAGALVTESFVNGHLHLDKVFTLDRIGDAALTAYTSGEPGSALRSIHHPTLREVPCHHRAPRHVIASGTVVAGTTSSTDSAPAVRRLAGDALDRERTP